MMDYRIHVAALEALREQLALSNITDPEVASLRDQQINDVDQEPASALLGSLIDHIVNHAASDRNELSLLTRASKLWQDGLALYSTLENFRTSLEIALDDPSDIAALQNLNILSEELQFLAQKVLNQNAEIKALRADIVKMPHLPEHGRQMDYSLPDWSWGDIFLARRTEAFVREVMQLADDTSTSAFAFGVLSSYGANAAGSAYLGQVVGGPRRSHRFRDRLARNSLGSWVVRENPFTPSLKDLEQQLTQAFPAGLSIKIEEQINTAVEKTYDLDVVPNFPNLQLGYERLLSHIRLLTTFVIPPPPAAPREPFLSRLFGDPANPYIPSMPEGTGLVESGSATGDGGSNPGSVLPQGMGTDDGPDHSEPPPSTEVKCGAFWEAIGWSFLFLLGGWIACVIRWQDGDRCQLWDDITQNWERAFPDGAQGAVEVSSGQIQPLTAENVEEIAQAEQILQFIGDLHNLQSIMWEGFNKAFDFLSLFGLIYPDGLLDRWRYSQYLSIPNKEKGDWPYLPDTSDRFDEFPTTGIELPASFTQGYPVGTTPAAIVARVTQAGLVSAADIGEFVWYQMANGDMDSTNLDLDADRGWKHPCWDADGSITDQPIDVRILPYDET
jgi:hypothetical protein